MRDLSAFRERVHALYRAVPHPREQRKLTQADLAAEVGLHPTELSKRLNGTGKVALSADNARAVVRALARLGALQTQVDALELLRLADVSLPDDEWQQPPFSKLAVLSPAAQAHIGQPGNNLPLPVPGFVGRAAEMTAVQALLAENRLVTITGSGGIGKTRLAIELGAALLEHYRHGAYLVSLVAVKGAAQVPRAVAAALGVRDAAGRDLATTLVDYLYARQLLLILDNCEHLITECGRLAAQLLERCPTLQILATSREPLGVAGEVSFILPPLMLPPVAGAPRTIRAASATQLFVDRAQAAHPGFGVTAANAESVALLMRQLEGIPLAIELAAPQVRSMSVEQMARRFGAHLRLLRSTDPSIPDRHRTLWASISWSYELLSDAEQSLLQRLSVFVAGWTAAAAEAVCADDENILETHDHLVTKSLVLAEEEDGTMRYRLLASVREYAGEHLRRNGDEERRQERHASYFLEFAQQIAAQRDVVGETIWLDELEREHSNLLAALEFCLREKPAAAVTLLLVLAPFWEIRGPFSEAREYLAASLSAADQLTRAQRAALLYWAGHFATEQSQYAEATAFCATALQLAEQVDDKAIICDVLGEQGAIAAKTARYDDARRLYSSSLGYAQILDHSDRQARAQLGLGHVMQYLGDYGAAQQYYREAVTLYQRADDQRGIAEALSGLGDLAYRQGNFAGALRCYEECLAINRALGDRVNIASGLYDLGLVLLRRGDYAAARTCYEQSLAAYKALGNPGAEAYVLGGLAEIAYEQGQYAVARNSYRESLRILRRLGKPSRVADVLHSLGLVYVATGQTELAAAAFEESLSICEDLGEQRAKGAALLGLADVAAATGDLPGAARLYRESLKIALDLDTRRDVVHGLVGLASTLVRGEANHDATTGVALLSAATLLLEQTGVKLHSWYEAQYRAARELGTHQLDAESFASAWRQGQARQPAELFAAMAQDRLDE